MNAAELAHLAWIIPLAILIGYIGSPRFRGTMAQNRVRRILDAGLEPRRYTIRHSLEIPAGGGTERLDHVVVCKAAIFVIQAIYRTGWISGARVQDRWKQETLLGTRRFDNPVHRNELRLDALAAVLDIPRSRLRSFIVFCGHKGFRKGIPDNVMGVNRLLAAIRSPTSFLLSEQECNDALSRLRSTSVQAVSSGTPWRWQLLRGLLAIVLAAGVFTIYREELAHGARKLQKQADMRMDPARFQPDGTPKTERELWLDTLNCALSVDTGRCACYEPGGGRADLAAAECRELAERGSILRQ